MTLAVQDNIIDAVETIASKVKVDELWIAQTKNQIVRRCVFFIFIIFEQLKDGTIGRHDQLNTSLFKMFKIVSTCQKELHLNVMFYIFPESQILYKLALSFSYQSTNFKRFHSIPSILEMIDKSADMVDLMGKPGSATIRENIALFVDKVDLTTSLLVNLNIADTSNLYTTELVMTNTEKKDIVRRGFRNLFWLIVCDFL